MPQFDWKGSPRGAVTGVERGGEVERVAIARRTAVLVFRRPHCAPPCAHHAAILRATAATPDVGVWGPKPECR
eukprot:COSAG06_NODE_37829_length_430_cov_2.018127_1_plen_72_part_10